MKKIILLFLSTILFSTSLFATEKLYSFIGVQASASNFDNVSTPSIGLKYGKQSKEMRTSIAYSYANKSSDTFQSLIMQVDSAILTQTFKEIAFKPYLGASFGLIQQKNRELLGYDDKGFVYGINAGLSYIVNNNVDFDLGYRFLKTSKMKELDKINDLSLSLHYFY
jgi:opacity protein-like surface antigen